MGCFLTFPGSGEFGPNVPPRRRAVHGISAIAGDGVEDAALFPSGVYRPPTTRLRRCPLVLSIFLVYRLNLAKGDR